MRRGGLRCPGLFFASTYTSPITEVRFRRSPPLGCDRLLPVFAVCNQIVTLRPNLYAQRTISGVRAVPHVPLLRRRLRRIDPRILHRVQ